MLRTGLGRGGVLAFVIPLRCLLRRILRIPDLASYLASQYEYFKQFLLLAQRRGKYNVPTNDEVEAIRRLAEDHLPPLDFAPEPIYPVLPAPLKGAGGRAILFRRLDWSPEDPSASSGQALVEASRWSGVRRTRAWQDLVHPVKGEVAFTLVIAAGEANDRDVRRSRGLGPCWLASRLPLAAADLPSESP